MSYTLERISSVKAVNLIEKEINQTLRKIAACTSYPTQFFHTHVESIQDTSLFNLRIKAIIAASVSGFLNAVISFAVEVQSTSSFDHPWHRRLLDVLQDSHHVHNGKPKGQ